MPGFVVTGPGKFFETFFLEIICERGINLEKNSVRARGIIFAWGSRGSQNILTDEFLKNF
jgi:hypothetical protein